MGVIGLWQLLQPSSRPLKLQGLEGKKLAIDISIWLYQATKGARNSRNGHITVLYNRICKLLYFKIKPIFVFDGPNVPKLKERVLQNRQRRRNEAANKAKDYDEKLQKNLLESIALKNVLCIQTEAPTEVKPTTSKEVNNKRSDYIDDLFKLPEKSEFDKNTNEDDEIKIESDEIVDLTNSVINFNDIDKEIFDSLPPDIQFEILTNYKDALKAKKSQSFDEFPENSEDFSTHQMKLLLHKSKISSQINDLKNSMKSNQIKNSDFDNIYHKKIASEDHDEVILLTKKNSASKLFSQKSGESVQLLLDEESNSNSVQLKYEEPINKSPEYRIEFNEFNKIQLVPKDSQVKPTFQETVEIVNTQNEIPKVDLTTNNEKNFKETKTDLEIINDKNNNNEVVLEIKSIDPEIFLINEKQDIKVLSQSKSIEKEKPIILKEFINEKPPLVTNIEVIPIKETELITIDQEVIETDSNTDDDFVEVESVSPKVSPILKTNLISLSTETIQNLNKSTQPTSSIRSNQEEAINLEAYDDYNDYLLNERSNLLHERNENERLSHSIESYVIEDTKYLLQLFGLPYLNAPGEAEAQCAYLDHTNITEGSITEDSDVWLFGARRVYKNFFSTDQFIDTYSNQIIKSQLGLDRETLICVALLVGSDYTEGIENVGIVKAVEILQEFEGQGLEKLKNFKEWHNKAKTNPCLRNVNKIRTQLSKLNLPDNFPSDIVYNAYTNPEVDKSGEEFSWSLPNLDQLRKYLASKLGWSNKKVDDDLLPVIRRINETNVQKTIDNFFAYETTSSFSKQSKRMKNAISSFKSKNTNEKSNENDLNLSEDDEEGEKTKEAPKRISKSSIKITRLKKNKSKDDDDDVIDDDDLILIDKPSTSSTSTKRKSSKSQTINNKVAKKTTK